MSKFFKKFNSYEAIRYDFENDKYESKSYIIDSYDFQTGESYFNFHCIECNKEYPVSELTFKDKKIHCACGASYSADELKPHMHDYLNYYPYSYHNLTNGTFNKVSVPTLMNREKLYCPKCHHTHLLENLKIDNKQRVCKCGAKYSFDDVKLVAGTNATNFTSGNVYFDGHKITMSFLEYYTDINANGQFYWQSGGQRLTMNLETGFSYVTNSGFRYREYNKMYKRDNNDKNAPTMFNCTYTSNFNTLELVARAKFDNLLVKYSNYPNLIKLMHNRKTLEKLIFNKLFKQIDEYMTTYYNNKYSYKIKSLIELSSDRFFSYHSYLLPLRNRFINLTLDQLDRARYILENIKYLEIKRNYKRLSRETNNLFFEYICKTTKLSKNLRKTVYAELQTCNHFPNTLDVFTAYTRFFNNKENVNKVYKTFTTTTAVHRLYTYKMEDGMMKLWMKYRNEHYMSNLNFNEIVTKVNYMHDAYNSIKKIKSAYGDDWDINSVRFYNEKQFHDNLVEITTTEEFITLYNKDKAEKELKPFEMENEVYELEDESNNILIAKNRAMLTNIGQAMGICVGGYGGQVESGHCRIAYIKVNGAYEVCIELTKCKNPETKKWEYTIVQAKLRYNSLVASNPFYYNIVKEWADKNNIKISTYDMKVIEKPQIVCAN